MPSSENGFLTWDLFLAPSIPAARAMAPSTPRSDIEGFQ
jgi:hypothetical protein